MCDQSSNNKHAQHVPIVDPLRHCMSASLALYAIVLDFISHLRNIVLSLPALHAPLHLASLTLCVLLHPTSYPFVHHGAWLHWPFVCYYTWPPNSSCTTCSPSLALCMPLHLASSLFVYHVARLHLPFVCHYIWPLNLCAPLHLAPKRLVLCAAIPGGTNPMCCDI